MSKILINFSDVFDDNTKYYTKIPALKYRKSGKFPIVDQGQNLIAGYTDNDDGICSDVPAIIFGDHTRIFKYMETPFLIGADGAKVLSPKIKNVNRKYLYYTLLSLNIENHGYSRHYKFLKEKKITLYSVEEQQHIVKVIDTINDIIEKRKQQISKLDELENSLFIDMFGDPITNPMGWDIKKISDFTNVETGSTPSRTHQEYYVKNGIPWVKTGEVDNSEIWETSEFISQDALDNSNCKLLPVNTILLAMYGQGITRGKVGILKIEATTNQACAAILPNDRYNSLFLLELMKQYYNILRGISRGGNQKNLNLGLVKGYQVIFPPIELQNAFSSKLIKIENTKKKTISCLKTMQEAYNALMQKFFE